MVGAYFLRQRPIWLGLWLGVAILNREFAAIGFIALLCLDGLQGELRRSWRARFLTASVMVGLFFTVFTLAAHFTHWRGPRPEIGSARFDNVRGFFVMQLPCLLGALERPLSAYNITSHLHAGHSLVYLAFFGWIGVVTWQLRRGRFGQLEGFAVYLLLIGGGQALAFLLFVPAPFDSTLLRYILPCLLAVCGLVAFAWRKPELRGVTAAFVLTTCGANVWDHVRLLDEYIVHTPKRDLQRLAEVLVHANIRYARAGYWVAYDLSFITHQHVLVVPTSDDRIPRFDRVLQQHSSEVVTLAEHSCPAGMRAQSPALQWLVCEPSQ
jgi:phosphatidylglycerophosphate synthase